jgi:hypothetical protein
MLSFGIICVDRILKPWTFSCCIFRCKKCILMLFSWIRATNIVLSMVIIPACLDNIWRRHLRFLPLWLLDYHLLFFFAAVFSLIFISNALLTMRHTSDRLAKSTCIIVFPYLKSRNIEVKTEKLTHRNEI